MLDVSRLAAPPDDSKSADCWLKNDEAVQGISKPGTADRTLADSGKIVDVITG